MKKNRVCLHAISVQTRGQSWMLILTFTLLRQGLLFLTSVYVAAMSFGESLVSASHLPVGEQQWEVFF